jgi:ribosome-binding protein aMBF1 (putative translation factor)
MKRIARDRHLTSEEAEKYNAIRGQIEQEKQDINDRIRKRIASQRKTKASQSGGQTVGERIRAARESLGTPQVELAAAAGISQDYLSQLEADEREPTLSIAARLAQALGMSLDELASGAVG